MSWFNDGLRRWVVWAPGSDAPPLPPGWVAGPGTPRPPGPDARPQPAPATPPVDAMSRRPSMRSPYRLVPLLITVFIIAIAVWQATRPPARATNGDIAAAEALKGECLARTGGTTAAPDYSPVPVSCAAGNASVKVVAVVVLGSGRPVSCPQGSIVVQVLEPNVKGEPSECVLPLRK